jgi:hypothetical protein
MVPVDELAKWLVSLGVGGAIAALVLSFYRKDIKQYTELWRLTTQELINVIKENTASNVKLINLIETQERNALRKTDIEFMVNLGIKNRLEELRSSDKKTKVNIERDMSGNSIDEK